MMWIARHGDLLIRKTQEIPSNLKPANTATIAEGEKTGHRHQLQGNVTVYKQELDTLYFEVKTSAELVHQEHKTIPIPEGMYMVQQEREFNPFENIRRVILD
ncbi:MAG: hypothetical protein OEW49_05425 [Nitrosopumilus sp.]|nr:hypothetical protein [Nitrosopumilus sp.]